MGNIEQWLDDPNRDYGRGIELYTAVKHSKPILIRLTKKSSEANMRKLIYELGKFREPKLQVNQHEEIIGEKYNAIEESGRSSKVSCFFNLIKKIWAH